MKILPHFCLNSLSFSVSLSLFSQFTVNTRKKPASTLNTLLGSLLRQISYSVYQADFLLSLFLRLVNFLPSHVVLSLPTVSRYVSLGLSFQRPRLVFFFSKGLSTWQITTWQLASIRVSQSNQKQKSLCFGNLISEVTFSQFWQSPGQPILKGRELKNNKTQILLGPILEAGSYSNIVIFLNLLVLIYCL